MQTITLPKQVVVKVLKASAAFEALHDELEDYLIASKAHIVRTLRRARREHVTGKIRPFLPPR